MKNLLCVWCLGAYAAAFGSASVPQMWKAPSGEDYRLVWNDEFEGREIDRSKWDMPIQFRQKGSLWHPSNVYLTNGIAHFDIKLNTDGIFALQSAAREFLRTQNVAPKLVNEIELIIEEALTHIRERNKKDILCECVFLVNDEHIRMISKDNGRIFNLLEEAEASADLRCYVMARVMESAKERSNTTTSSFNRNTFIWMR